MFSIQTNLNNHCEKIQIMDQGKIECFSLNIESKEFIQQNQVISADYFALLNLQETDHIEPQIFELVKCPKANLTKYFKDHQNINYNPNLFEESISISVLYHTANYEVMKINVKYGFFSMQLSIINVDANSPSDNLQIVSSGGFGDVYKTWAEQQQIVIKKIRVQEDQYAKTLTQTIKQYFILAVASSLSCAPRVHKIYGFDMVIFRNSIEFSMECCIKNTQVNPSLHGLKKKLYLLHALHIIHCDIKPDNIAYSRAFSCFVFLDFGLSFIAKEKIGQRILTSFVGSVQFCTKQLWELFMRNNTDSVDLYLNDAFTLDKTISAFQLSNPVVKRQVSSQVLDYNDINFVDGKDPQKFYRYRGLIFIKSIFFNIAMDNSFKESDLINQQLQMDTYMSKIVQFIKMLPLNQLLIYIFKKYCKYGEDDNIDRGIYKTCVRFIQDQTRGDDNYYTTFIIRYNWIKSLNSSRQAHQLMTRLKERKRQISEKSFQLNKDDSAYSMTIVKIIKINGQTDNFDDKIFACKDYLSRFGINFQQMTQRQMYNRTILQIFNSSLSNFQADQLIFKHTIQTIIILELLPEDRLLQSYRLVLKASLSFVEKITFVLQFLTALQFINQKYMTAYNYEDLVQVMLIDLNNQLDIVFEQRAIINVEQLCFYRLKQVIVQRIGFTGQIKNQSNLPAILISNKDQVMNEQNILLSDIQAYLIYLQGLFQFNNGNVSSQNHHKQIFNLISAKNSQLNHFSYLHFYYFESTFAKNEDYFNSLTFQLFQKQLGPFQQLIHYKIYFKSKVKMLNCNLLQAYLRQRMSKNERQEFVKAKVSAHYIKDIKEILGIFKGIIEKTSQFHIYVSAVFELLPLQNKPLMQNLKQFFLQNINKLVAFSKKYHKNGPFNHNNFLKIQITTINNIIYAYKRITHLDTTSLIQAYFQQALRVVQNSQCFLCKASCLLELKFIEAYNYNKQHPQEQLILLADMITTFFKHKQLFVETQRAILNIVRFIFRNKQLRQRFSLRQFLYLTSIQLQNACFCLTYLQQCNIFIQVYFHLLQSYSAVQLCQFILEILRVIQYRRSVDHIIKFYHSSVTIIKLSRQDKQSCKQYYHQVLKYLFSHEKFKHNPYIALYLLTLLQMNIKGIYQQNIIKIIKKGITRVDNFTKRLLLNQYYLQYAFYFDPVARKMKFLKRLHFKHTFTEFSKEFIYRRKISIKNIKKVCPLKLNKLQNAISNYHNNLQNLKHKNKKQ